MMLRGMNCDKFIENFAKANVNLFEFLTMTDKQLKEIGISFSFERNAILVGLFNFHNEPWTFDSLFIPEDKNLSDMDTMIMLVNVLRQLVVIKSQIVYIEGLGQNFKMQRAYKNISLELFNEFQENVKKMQKLLGKQSVEKPLMIKPKKENVKIVEKVVKISAIAFIPIIVFTAFKVIRK